MQQAERAPDWVRRNFTATAPNQLWVVDFTYLETEAGKAFAAFVQDVFSRRIVGWAVADHHLTELPLAALEMALYARARAGHDVKDVVHHSDAGAEYTAIRLPASSFPRKVGWLGVEGVVDSSAFPCPWPVLRSSRGNRRRAN